MLDVRERTVEKNGVGRSVSDQGGTGYRISAFICSDDITF